MGQTQTILGNVVVVAAAAAVATAAARAATATTQSTRTYYSASREYKNVLGMHAAPVDPAASLISKISIQIEDRPSVFSTDNGAARQRSQTAQPAQPAQQRSISRHEQRWGTASPSPPVDAAVAGPGTYIVPIILEAGPGDGTTTTNNGNGSSSSSSNRV